MASLLPCCRMQACCVCPHNTHPMLTCKCKCCSAGMGFVRCVFEMMWRQCALTCFEAVWWWWWWWQLPCPAPDLMTLTLTSQHCLAVLCCLPQRCGVLAPCHVMVHACQNGGACMGMGAGECASQRADLRLTTNTTISVAAPVPRRLKALGIASRPAPTMHLHKLTVEVSTWQGPCWLHLSVLGHTLCRVSCAWHCTLQPRCKITMKKNTHLFHHECPHSLSLCPRHFPACKSHYHCDSGSLVEGMVPK